MPRVIPAFSQFFDGAGNPLIDGWLRFLVSGTTSTDKNTYMDLSETLPNTNPVQLDAEGRCPNIFGTGSYRVISYTNDEVLQTPAVQIQQFDPVPGGLTSAGDWAIWTGTAVYEEGDIVKGDDGLYYISIISPNEGQNPSEGVSPIYWQRFDFVYYYNANVVYLESMLVQFTDGSLYFCKADTTVGQSPITNPEKWDPATRIFKNAQEIEKDYGVFVGGTEDIDLSLGNIALFTISTATQEITFSGIGGAGFNSKVELRITNGGSQTITWPAGTKWAGAEAPTLTEAGIDTLIFEFSGAATAPFAYVSAQEQAVVA